MSHYWNDPSVPCGQIPGQIIHDNFHIDAYRRRKKIPIRDLIDGFSNKISKFSQIDAIIDRLKSTLVELGSILVAIGKDIVVMSLHFEDSRKRQLSFIGKQLMVLDVKPQGRRFSPEHMMQAIVIYL